MEPSVTNHLHSPYVPLLGQEVSAGIRADYCAQSGEKEGLQVQQKGGDPHREAADPRPGRRLRAGGSECGLSTSTSFHRTALALHFLATTQRIYAKYLLSQHPKSTYTNYFGKAQDQ